jgi:hypothetical protein
MILLTYPLAFFILALEGTLFIRLLEGRSPVLYHVERWCTGFLLASALTSFLFLWGFLFGVPLNLAGFLGMHAVTLLILLGLTGQRFPRFCFPPSPSMQRGGFRTAATALKDFRSQRPQWVFILLCVLLIWTGVKIGAGLTNILTIPSYWNDTYASWNMRAKVLYKSENLLIGLPKDHEYYFGGRVASYPLTVYFTKIWFAHITGGFTLSEASGASLVEGWNDTVVNSLSFAWFILLLTCVFLALLRETNLFWSITGLYLLVSLPLVLMHGTNAYSDGLMAAHLFLALHFFYRWVREDDSGRKQSWLLLFGAAAGAMTFIKNEAMLIYLPPLVLFFVIHLWKICPSIDHLKKPLLQFCVLVGFVSVPWVLFKIGLGLTFGNATAPSTFSLIPNEDALYAMEGDLLYTGSYLLFFPLLILLIFLTFHFWRKHAVGFLILFLIIVLIGEICIYWLTPIATEAIRHTAFGRGMVHLIPGAVFAVVILLRHLFGENPLRKGA